MSSNKVYIAIAVLIVASMAIWAGADYYERHRERTQEEIYSPGSEVEYAKLIQEGLALYNDYQFEESIKVWKQALELRPDDATATANITSSLILLGRYDEAIDMLNKALAKDPGSPFLLSNLKWAKEEKAKNEL